MFEVGDTSGFRGASVIDGEKSEEEKVEGDDAGVADSGREVKVGVGLGMDATVFDWSD